MHCLYGLQQLGMTFELKGGTSLSKGFQIINRFSEDIDIRIEPPKDQDVKTGRNQDKPAHVKSRKDFYDWLAKTIHIDGIEKVERDTAFDNKTTSAAASGFSTKLTEAVDGLKAGVLLEARLRRRGAEQREGYQLMGSTIMPPTKCRSSTTARKASLVTIPAIHSSKNFRPFRQNSDCSRHRQEFPINFMRHYYDVYSLLQRPEVQAFIGTDAYKAHKAKRFRRADNPNIAQNEAFILSDPETRKTYERAYAEAPPYYGDKPTFDQMLKEIAAWADRL